MLPRNYSVLVVGSPSAGMFEFCCFLTATYLKGGESVVYVEADTYPDQAWRQLYRFGVDVRAEEREGKLAIVDCYSTGAFKRPLRDTIVVGDVTDLGQILTRIGDGINKVGGLPVRVIFNSITPLFLKNEPKQVAWFFRELSSRVTLNGILTTTVHREILEDKDVATLTSIVDGVIELMVNGDFRRHIRIKHMRGVNVNPKWVPFDFEMGDEENVATFLRWR